MDFLGIGPLELLFIIVIIIVVVGPRDIQKTARGLGRGLNSVYKSEGWKAFNEVSKQLRGLPNRLAREAELEELQRAAQETAAAVNPMAAWTPAASGNSGSPPAAADAEPAGNTPAAPAMAADTGPAGNTSAAPAVAADPGSAANAPAAPNDGASNATPASSESPSPNS